MLENKQKAFIQSTRRMKGAVIAIILVALSFSLAVNYRAMGEARLWEGVLLTAVVVGLSFVLPSRYSRWMSGFIPILGITFLCAVALRGFPPIQGTFRAFLGGMGLGCILPWIAFVWLALKKRKALVPA